MKLEIKADIQPAAILRSRGLGESPAARKHLAATVKRLNDPYVPMQQGTMKNTAQIINEGRGVKYPQPYSHYQYVGEIYGPNIQTGDGGFFSPVAPKRPTGRTLTYHGAPMRGPNWDKRMMADRGDEVVDDLAAFVGGKRK